MALPHKATAVFAVNDSLALGALRYCKKAGIGVPDSMAVVGFDNVEYGEFAITPLSSVNYDINLIAGLAIDRLMTLIEARDSLPLPRVTMIEPGLVVRESTAGSMMP